MVFEVYMKMKRRKSKKNKLNANSNYVSPLLRQDNESVENNQKGAYYFPTTSKQADSSENRNDKNSSLFKENTNGAVTLPHSLLVQPESEFTVASSKMSFNFTATTSKSSKELEAVIPTKGQKILPHISTRPINELLEVPLEPLRGSSKKQKKDDMVIEKSLSKRQVESRPLEPLCGSSKKQKKDDMVIEKSLSKLRVESRSLEPLCGSSKKQKKDDKVIEKSLSKRQVESQPTNNQINVSTVEIKVESDAVKTEPNIINSESSSSESSSSEDEDVELSKALTIDDSVIVLEDSASEDETDKQEDEILLDDFEVDKMSLSQELDARFQSKKVLLQNQIFVGNLPSSMEKLHVSKFFERYGNIVDLKFIRSKVNKTTICFITFEDRNSVNSSLEANGLLYCGHNFRVAKVGRFPVIVDCTVMVTNLPDDTSTQNLYDVFETCGLIRSQYLAKTKDKLQAYITFELKISAAYAVLLNNFHLKGCKMNVHQYENQREKQGLSNKIS